MKSKLKDWYDAFREKYWRDPVWSKVIAAGITSVIAAILGSAWLIIKSIYAKISIEAAFTQVISYFRDSSQINNLLIWLSAIILMLVVIKFFRGLILEIVKKIKKKNLDKEEAPSEKPTIHEKSTVFFSNRLAKSFPGQRGLKWYDAKTGADRLQLLFQGPLEFKAHEYHAMGDPIWWFRGTGSVFINSFRRLSKTKILIGRQELELKRIAVSIDDSFYEKCFIYIEAKGEKPTKFNQLSDEDIQQYVNSKGYCSEAYGVWKNTEISSEEYSDGAIVRNNKVIEISDVEPRTRYLTDYNLLITAKQSPYNSQRFCRETESMFKDILLGKLTAEEFFEYLGTYSKESWRD